MENTATQYVMIGSGVAAVTLAERLLTANPDTHILILEAGAVYPAMDRRAWWDYVMSGKAVYSPAGDKPDEYSVNSNVNWDCNDNRLIAYGGSTLHWGGWSLRFKPEDFHLRENTGQGADWPFGYAELHDYYYEAEHLLGVCGDDRESWNHVRNAVVDEQKKIVVRAAQPYPLPPFEWTAADGEMIAAFRELGIEPGRLPIARYRKCMATGTCKYCPLGARYTAQNALDDLRNRQDSHGRVRYSNLKIETRSPATRILMNSKRVAAGVEYVNENGVKQKVLAGTVVVCAGTYESPKMLLQSSNNDWPDGIGNRHGHVGRNLVSHSILRVRGTNRSNKECWVQEYDFPTLMSRTYDTPEYQQHGKLFLFKNRKFPHLEFAAEMSKDRSKEQIEQSLRSQRTMELQAFLEEKGRYENYVTLSNERTRWGLPKTHVVFNRTDAETANANSRVAILKRVIREMGYTVSEAQVDRPGGHHSTGTCRMANSAKDGVTDANLRVYGTENVFVCSNAVFPTCSAVNPTLTLTAMSLRLGDHLIDRSGGLPAARNRSLNVLRNPTSVELANVSHSVPSDASTASSSPKRRASRKKKGIQ